MLRIRGTAAVTAANAQSGIDIEIVASVGIDQLKRCWAFPSFISIDVDSGIGVKQVVRLCRDAEWTGRRGCCEEVRGRFACFLECSEVLHEALVVLVGADCWIRVPHSDHICVPRWRLLLDEGLSPTASKVGA